MYDELTACFIIYSILLLINNFIINLVIWYIKDGIPIIIEKITLKIIYIKFTMAISGIDINVSIYDITAHPKDKRKISLFCQMVGSFLIERLELNMQLELLLFL